MGIVLVNIAAIMLVLKKTTGIMRLPGGPIVPIIGLLSCFAELYLLGFMPIAWSFVAIGVGGLLYIGRKYFHNPVYHKELKAELEKYGGPVLRAMRKMEGHL